MNDIIYKHINCKELDYIYSILLNYYQNINSDKYVNLDYLINSISSENNNDSYMEIACLNNKLIGFIHYDLNNHFKTIEHINKCEINFMTVNCHYRKKGIGTELLNRAFDNINKMEIDSCYLDCSNEFNHDGFKFWLQYGEVIKQIQERNYTISNIEIKDIKKRIRKLN